MNEQTTTRPDTALLARIADGESLDSIAANEGRYDFQVLADAVILLRALSPVAADNIPDNDTFANYLRSIRFELGF